MPVTRRGKGSIIAAVLVALSGSLILSGCGNSADTQPPVTAPAGAKMGAPKPLPGAPAGAKGPSGNPAVIPQAPRQK